MRAFTFSLAAEVTMQVTIDRLATLTSPTTHSAPRAIGHEATAAQNGSNLQDRLILKLPNALTGNPKEPGNRNRARFARSNDSGHVDRGIVSAIDLANVSSGQANLGEKTLEDESLARGAAREQHLADCRQLLRNFGRFRNGALVRGKLERWFAVCFTQIHAYKRARTGLGEKPHCRFG
jgi:hypothetical protein